MPSFDIVSEVNTHEISNAVDQVNREISTRYDFKGINATVELSGESVILVKAESDFQLQQIADIFKQKVTKRGLELGSFVFEEPKKHLSNACQEIRILQGIESEIAKKIIKNIKDSKIKVQTAIQGKQLRVTGKKRDDLQQVIALLREMKLCLPLQYTNFRD